MGSWRFSEGLDEDPKLGFVGWLLKDPLDDWTTMVCLAMEAAI
jgi:hypothetical protein